MSTLREVMPSDLTYTPCHPSPRKAKSRIGQYQSPTVKVNHEQIKQWVREWKAIHRRAAGTMAASRRD